MYSRLCRVLSCILNAVSSSFSPPTRDRSCFNLRYDDLKKSCSARNAVLEHSRRQHALARESDDLLRWIENRKQLVNTYELQGDEDGGLDEVQDLQKKLDEFQKVLG